MKVKTCLRYPGGKFYGLKKIRPFLKVNHDEYREPFIGGGSVFLDKELVPNVNWINDIDEELINFYQVIQNKENRLKLFSLLENEVATKERHKQVKSMIIDDNIKAAFRFFYLNRTSFSGIMVKPRWGYAIGSSVPPEKWTKIIKPVAEKLQGVKITNLDFREVIQLESKHKNVLLYLDPPYFKASKSIYNHEFSLDDHLDLCDQLKATKFKFVLSYKNCEEIKKLYNWAYINELDWTYFMSEARRQEGKELLISNFKYKLDDFFNK